MSVIFLSLDSNYRTEGRAKWAQSKYLFAAPSLHLINKDAPMEPNYCRAEQYERSHGPLHLWHPKRARVRRTVTMPTASVHPLVKLVFGEMARQRRTYSDLVESSGIQRASIKAWRAKNAPGLATITAVLNSLGIDLVPVPAPEVLPADVAGDLSALAAKLETGMPEAWAAVVSFGINQQLARESAAQILGRIDEARATPEGVKRRRSGTPRLSH